MLVHVLGVLDLLSAGLILGGHFNLVNIPLIYVAIYLLSKLLFFHDVLSFVDAAAAIYAIALIFMDGGTGLTWLFMIYFGYKTSMWLFYSFSG